VIIDFEIIFRLPEDQSKQLSSFSIFDMFDLPSKVLCLSKALEPSKGSSSEGITAKQKISKSNLAQNITSNDIFRLPGSQHNQSSSFRFLTLLTCRQNFYASVRL